MQIREPQACGAGARRRLLPGWLLGVLLWFCAVVAAAQTSPPPLTITCAVAASRAAGPGTAENADTYCAGSTGSVLHGTGELEVVVTKASWQSALSAAQQKPPRAYLFLNGIPSGAPAPAIREHPNGWVSLVYRVGSGDEARDFWTSLYRQHGITPTSDLGVSLGWSAAAPNTAEAGRMPKVRIASDTRLWSSVAVLLLFVVLFLWALFGTDAFRDASPPQWWLDAAQLARTWARRRADVEECASACQQPRSLRCKQGFCLAKEAGEEGAFLRFARLTPYGVGYNKADRPQYTEAAKFAMAGAPVQALSINDTVLGLTLWPTRWSRIRGTFSLARVQTGLWLFFLVASAVYIRLVTGELAGVEPTLVGLVSVSAVTSLASFAVDRNAGGRPFTPSQGFFSDLTTGWDGAQQLHRIQAIAVNTLLLFTGVDAVLHDLAFPKVHDSWLALLGVSGVVQTVGKQVLEKVKPGAQAAFQPSTDNVSASVASAPGPSLPAGRSL